MFIENRINKLTINHNLNKFWIFQKFLILKLSFTVKTKQKFAFKQNFEKYILKKYIKIK